MSNGNVEIRDKILWTPEEASQMTNIGVNKIREICDKNPQIVVMNGARRLIVKALFERFLMTNREV